MSTVQSVDYVSRRVYLSLDTVGVPLDLLDVYRDVRALRTTNADHRKFKPMMVAGGNVRKTATTFTQPYVQLLNGCHIVPYPADQRLLVVREVFSDDGRYGVECFDRSGVSATVDIDIDMQINPVEVRLVNISGGSGLTPTQANQLEQAFKNSTLIPALL